MLNILMEEMKWTFIPALGVCSFAEPVKNGVFCQYILFIERPHNLREQLHELSILIALHLNFVHEFQLKFPIGAESIQQCRPCFHLYHKKLTPTIKFKANKFPQMR